MIPTIEQIIEDLLAGTIEKSRAINWLHSHADGSANENRDFFAGQALQAMLTGYYSDPAASGWADEDICTASYKYADAMLKASSK